MARTLLVTNDFPPRTGGIQTYLHAFADRLPAGELAVYAPAWPGPPSSTRRALPRAPPPDVAHAPGARGRRRAAAAGPRARRDDRLVRRGGAARAARARPAPAAPASSAWSASTHGHEVGWSMLPGGRQALRRIGARRRRRSPRSPATPAPASRPRSVRTRRWSCCRPGVDTERVPARPGSPRRAAPPLPLGDAPVVTCVSRLVARKGQDTLIRALPLAARAGPGARVLLVGDGPAPPGCGGWPTSRRGRARRVHRSRAGRRAAGPPRRRRRLRPAVPHPRRRARRRGPRHRAAGGRGVGPAGRRRRLRRGAETVLEGRTGHVVDGRDAAALAVAVAACWPTRSGPGAMGAAGPGVDAARLDAGPRGCRGCAACSPGPGRSPWPPGARPGVRRQVGWLTPVERGDVVGVLAVTTSAAPSASG